MFVRRDSGDSRETDGRAIDAGHEEAAEDDFVEGGVGPAWSVKGFVSSLNMEERGTVSYERETGKV